MKLKKEFSDFYKTIRIDSETNALRDKREILENDIKSKLPGILENYGINIIKSDIRMIDQGSYKYNTTIKDVVVDRDIAVMFPLDTTENSDPRKIKGYLRDSINISSRTVSIKEPCVRASYYEDGKEWLHIDLPLYAQDGNKVYPLTIRMHTFPPNPKKVFDIVPPFYAEIQPRLVICLSHMFFPYSHNHTTWLYPVWAI